MTIGSTEAEPPSRVDEPLGPRGVSVDGAGDVDPLILFGSRIGAVSVAAKAGS
jgi:hypothetical protein